MTLSCLEHRWLIAGISQYMCYQSMSTPEHSCSLLAVVYIRHLKPLAFLPDYIMLSPIRLKDIYQDTWAAMETMEDFPLGREPSSAVELWFRHASQPFDTPRPLLLQHGNPPTTCHSIKHRTQPLLALVPDRDPRCRQPDPGTGRSTTVWMTSNPNPDEYSRAGMISAMHRLSHVLGTEMTVLLGLKHFVDCSYQGTLCPWMLLIALMMSTILSILTSCAATPSSLLLWTKVAYLLRWSTGCMCLMSLGILVMLRSFMLRPDSSQASAAHIIRRYYSGGYHLIRSHTIIQTGRIAAQWISPAPI